MTEQKIQKKIIDYLKSKGAYVEKAVLMTTSGAPDIRVCYKGKFIAFEVKKPGGKLTPLQEVKLQKIREAGGVAEKVESLQEVKNIIENLEING